MAEAAEAIIEKSFTPPEHTQPEVPLVIVVPEMDQDELIRHRADKFIQAAGSVATREHVEVEHQMREQLPEDELTSLMDAVQRAAWGDKEAKLFIANNVRTDIFERTVKAGLVMKARLSVDQNGQAGQHGQSMKTTHHNALRFASAKPEIMDRSLPETRNGFRIAALYGEGLLDDYYFVVKSRCADNIPFEELDDNGFFSDTLSTSIQATTANENGLITESAFVAGVKKPGGQPHDAETVISIGEVLGVDYTGKTAAEIIDMPLLIHKSLMPNGVIDLVRLYDICAGGTFFGEDKPPQDYLEFVKFCEKRENELEPIVEKITQQLIDEADKIHTPLAAVKRLHQLSQKYMLERSIEDKTINPKVFGPAAPYIEQARAYRELGNTDLAQAAIDKAQQVAKSSSCPGAFLNNKELSKSQASESAEATETEDSRNGTLRCIKCRQYVPKEKVVKKDCWECPRCNHKVDICSGKVINEGSIALPEKEKTNVISIFGKTAIREPKELSNAVGRAA